MMTFIQARSASIVGAIMAQLSQDEICERFKMSRGALQQFAFTKRLKLKPVPRAGEIVWTDAQIAKLRELRAQGKPFSEIAKLIGVSRDAAIGKAHRLNISGTARPRSQRQHRKAAEAPMPPLLARMMMQAPPPRPPAPLPVARRVAYADCCWPIGEPRTPGFRYCDAPSVQGHYCAEHHGMAYVAKRAA